mmetsp:Transcript_714/g.1950  ORF Transcript_714/g.1950 Transcript_714/m.1950 type:complete len:128 (+) Transcript_714:215-598(+)
MQEGSLNNSRNARQNGDPMDEPLGDNMPLYARSIARRELEEKRRRRDRINSRIGTLSDSLDHLLISMERHIRHKFLEVKVSQPPPPPSSLWLTSCSQGIARQKLTDHGLDEERSLSEDEVDTHACRR